MPANAALWVTRHWLALANAFLVAFAGLPLAEPLLRAGAMTVPADAIFQAYSLVCHQMPSRSYVVAGYQMAYCERNTAIYATMALASLLWARVHRRLPRLHWSLFVLLTLPIALDGFTQLFALRESTWELRTITGALFGLACVWFGFPLLAVAMKLTRMGLRFATPRPRLQAQPESSLCHAERSEASAPEPRIPRSTWNDQGLPARPRARAYPA